MPNVDSLQKFVKVTNVQNGDIVHFCDAGQIIEKEFEDKQSKVKKTMDVLEMEVIINEDMKRKIYSPNTTTRELLKAAWGPDTANWVGKSGFVQIIEQISFGKLTPVLIIKPCTPPPQKPPVGSVSGPVAKLASPAAAIGSSNPAGEGVEHVTDPADIQWKD